jgi:nucleoside-diphosphate-sugar epimerase
MQVCVIGGTGHIGKNLVQMLLGEGHAVTVITTGRTPIPNGWESVNVIQRAYRRGDAEWATFLRDLAPEVLVDILGADAPGVYEAVKGSCQHLLLVRVAVDVRRATGRAHTRRDAKPVWF